MHRLRFSSNFINTGSHCLVSKACRKFFCFIFWVAFCFAKIRLFRVALSLHSFAPLRNWLRQPLQSLPLGQTHYKMISCNIWLPVVIHRSKTRNNALDVFWGIETIIMPLSRQPQKKSFCPVSHFLAPTFMSNFYNAFALLHFSSICIFDFFSI